LLRSFPEDPNADGIVVYSPVPAESVDSVRRKSKAIQADKNRFCIGRRFLLGWLGLANSVLAPMQLPKTTIANQSLRKLRHPRTVQMEVAHLVTVSKSRGTLVMPIPIAARILSTVFRNGGRNPLGGKDHLLKFEPGGDLDAMQPQLIQEVVCALVPKVIIKSPVPHLGVDITSNLAAQCGVTLPGYIRSDSEPTDVGFGGEIERLAQI
jgi:hypothetical protein